MIYWLVKRVEYFCHLLAVKKKCSHLFFTALTASGSADQLSGRSTVRPMAMALGLQLETLVKLGCKVEVLLIILKCW